MSRVGGGEGGGIVLGLVMGKLGFVVIGGIQQSIGEMFCRAVVGGGGGMLGKVVGSDCKGLFPCHYCQHGLMGWRQEEAPWRNPHE